MATKAKTKKKPVLKGGSGSPTAGSELGGGGGKGKKKK